MAHKTLMIVLGATAAAGVLYFLTRKKSLTVTVIPATTAITTSGAPVNGTSTSSLTGLMNSGSPQNTSPVINSPYSGSTNGGNTTQMPGVKLYIPTIN